MKGRIVIKLSGRAFGAAGDVAGYAASIARIARARQPFVVAGGGEVARSYISRARSYGADESTLDEMGIEVSRLNARLLIAALGRRAWPRPPATLREAEEAAASGLVAVSGGLHPGHSTNGTAALIAERIGAAEFLNATDVDGVYDRDPNRHPGARLLKRIGVADLRGMLAGEDSAAGGYDLMDIVALQVIERSRIRTRILRAAPAAIERAARGGAAGTEVTLPRRPRARRPAR